MVVVVFLCGRAGPLTKWPCYFTQARQGKERQGKARQDWQGKARHSKAKQKQKTKQNKTKQNAGQKQQNSNTTLSQCDII